MPSVYDIDLQGEPPVIDIRGLTVRFGGREAVKDLSLQVPCRRVVTLVGSSGCGKTTLLKSINRMNDLNEEAEVAGDVLLGGQNVYGPDVDPIAVRAQVGMVFQRPTPFPQSVFDNVAFGPRVNRLGPDLNGIVEESLRQAGLWSEVSDSLDESALSLSESQQQRLCIARALALTPQVVLMDEPASNLDPQATRGIEDLIRDLKGTYTIVIVTQSLQHAARVSDYTAYMEAGELVEYGPTRAVFTNPRESATEAFITGRIR